MAISLRGALVLRNTTPRDALCAQLLHQERVQVLELRVVDRETPDVRKAPGPHKPVRTGQEDIHAKVGLAERLCESPATEATIVCATDGDISLL